MLLERIQDFFILHRDLDPKDEDSTAEEQVEKLLYLYSKNCGDLNEKVHLITVVESLLEFTKFFSKTPLETAHMEKCLWSFYECEPGIWLVMSIYQDYAEINENDADSVRLTSAYSCRWFLKRLYSLLVTLFGPIQSNLNGSEQNGWECIMNVISSRKAVRKTKFKLGNAQNDYDILLNEQKEGVEREGMHNLVQQSEILIKELSENLQKYETNLSYYLSQSQYTLPSFQKKLQTFMSWYFSLEDLNDLNCFSMIREISFEKSRLQVTSGAIYHLIRHLKKLFPTNSNNLSTLPLSSSSSSLRYMITYDHRLLWTEIDMTTTKLLSEFLLRWESSFLLGHTNMFMHKAMRDFAKSIFHETKNDYASLEYNQKMKLADSVRVSTLIMIIIIIVNLIPLMIIMITNRI
jgi:hypothetical protein